MKADLKELVELAADPTALDRMLERALDALGTIIPYDLAAILMLEGNELAVRSSRGPLATEKVRHHRLQLRAFPTIRQAMELRRPIALQEHHHHSEEGDPYDGILDLPEGHSCMVVPLLPGSRTWGPSPWIGAPAAATRRRPPNWPGSTGRWWAWPSPLPSKRRPWIATAIA
ncbi:MAG TPA: hypothetical protein PKY30_07050 [Myxococcota bacterium]|nr:hypothetical protein [Myxococcota bacterium]